MKWAGIISDHGSVAPGTLGVFLQKKDCKQRDASRLS